MDADEVFRQFDIARWQFPGADVFASTYDNFNDALGAFQAATGALPVTSAEVGDTWMTSTTADPWKMAFYRECARAYSDCLGSGACDPRDARVSGFTRSEESRAPPCARPLFSRAPHSAP